MCLRRRIASQRGEIAGAEVRISHSEIEPDLKKTLIAGDVMYGSPQRWMAEVSGELGSCLPHQILFERGAVRASGLRNVRVPNNSYGDGDLRPRISGIVDEDFFSIDDTQDVKFCV